MKKLVIAVLLAASPMAFADVSSLTTFVSTPSVFNVSMNSVQVGGAATIGHGSSITLPGYGSASSAHVVGAGYAQVIGKGGVTVNSGGSVGSSASGN